MNAPAQSANVIPLYRDRLNDAAEVGQRAPLYWHYGGQVYRGDAVVNIPLSENVMRMRLDMLERQMTAAAAQADVSAFSAYHEAAMQLLFARRECRRYRSLFNL